MAVSFNGTSDEIDMGNVVALTPGGGGSLTVNGPISVVFWVNLATTSPAAQEGIVQKGFNGTNAPYGFSITIGPPSLSWGSFNTGSGSHGLTPSLATLGWSAGQWHHVYGDYTGSGTHLWNLYIDGIFNSSVSDTVGPLSGGRDFTIGAVDSSGSTIQFFSGCVADVAVFNGPLTGTEITNLGNGSTRPNGSMSQTLLGYWKLDTAAGTQNDLSGNGNNGTSTGTTTCGSSPPFTAGIVMMPASLRMT